MERPFIEGLVIRLVGTLADIFRLDLLDAAYRRDGIGNYRNAQESGERYVIHSLLPALFA